MEKKEEQDMERLRLRKIAQPNPIMKQSGDLKMKAFSPKGAEDSGRNFSPTYQHTNTHSHLCTNIKEGQTAQAN